jgi:hypothetical protein
MLIWMALEIPGVKRLLDLSAKVVIVDHIWAAGLRHMGYAAPCLRQMHFNLAVVQNDIPATSQQDQAYDEPVFQTSFACSKS